MAAIEVTVEGLPELSRQFDRLSAKLQRRTLRGALRKAGRPVLKEAKRLVPVKTKALKRSLAMKTSVTRTTAVMTVGARKGAKGSPSSRVHLTEKGTAHSAAKPFLRPALVNKKQEALDRFTSALREEIALVTARAAAAGRR